MAEYDTFTREQLLEELCRKEAVNEKFKKKLVSALLNLASLLKVRSQGLCFCSCKLRRSVRTSSRCWPDTSPWTKSTNYVF